MNHNDKVRLFKNGRYLGVGTYKTTKYNKINGVIPIFDFNGIKIKGGVDFVELSLAQKVEKERFGWNYEEIKAQREGAFI